MSLTQEEIFAQAKAINAEVALVKDGPIYYLVLGRQDNTFNFEIMKQIHACLDEVEKSTGPACLVTIGTGERMFSTGFDLKMWATGVIPQWQSVLVIQSLFDRMLTLGIPTVCIMNGLTIAGGLLFALMHDFRVMKEDKNFVCLSEINIGVSLTPAFASMVKYQLDP